MHPEARLLLILGVGSGVPTLTFIRKVLILQIVMRLFATLSPEYLDFRHLMALEMPVPTLAPNAVSMIDAEVTDAFLVGLAASHIERRKSARIAWLQPRRVPSGLRCPGGEVLPDYPALVDAAAPHRSDLIDANDKRLVPRTRRHRQVKSSSSA
jgi:hypothetical protein